MKELLAHLKSEFLAEYRNWHQSASLLLFLLTIAYVIYRVKSGINLMEFNFLFWLVMLLVSINIAIRGVNSNSSSERILTYMLVDPSIVLVTRLLFNFIYLLTAGVAFYLSTVFLFYPQISVDFGFIVLIFIACVAFSSVLSFTSAISRHISSQNTALSILSIPLLIPVVILLMDIGGNVLVNNPATISKYIAVIGISLLGISLSMILFPFIWRE